MRWKKQRIKKKRQDREMESKRGRETEIENIEND